MALYCLLAMATSHTYAQIKPAAIKNAEKIKQTSQEEKLARQLFQSLKTRNAQLFESLYPANEEYRQLLQLMVEYKLAGLTPENMEAMVLQHQQQSAGAYAADFRRLVKQADSAGIRWSNAVYKDFLFQPYVKNNFPRKYLSGDIWCMYGKTEFVIEGIEALETPAGFRLQSIQGIRKIEDSY